MNTPTNSSESDFGNSRLPARVPVAHSLRRPGQAISGVRPASCEGISPKFVLRVFANWWKWVIPLGVMIAIGAAVSVLMLYVPKYQAIALVKIEANAPFIAFEKGSFKQDSDLYVQTQIELLRGPVVLTPVLSRPEIASIPEIKASVDPLYFLRQHLTVRQVGKSELYEVSYISPSAQDSASVANVVVAEYLALQIREERQRSQMVIDVLEKERLERGTKVDQLRKRVVELARDLTGKDPFGQGAITDTVAFSPVAALYQSLTEADVNYEVLKAELQALKNAPIVIADKEIASGMIELEISNRPDVRRLVERLGAVSDQMTELKSQPVLKLNETIEDDPEYVRLANESQQIDAELKQLKSMVKQELVEMRQKQRTAERDSLVAAKQTELSLLVKRREMLSAKLDEQMGELKSGGMQSAELEFAKAELEREQNVFELIAARKLALQTEQRAPARVTLMQSAVPPQTAIEPIPYKYLLLACIAGLLSPLGLAVAYEMVTRRIACSEELSSESSLPVVGEVARFPRHYLSNRSPLALEATQQRELYIFTESIDSLRTQLMLTEQVGVVGHPRVVAICSACSGEGKSSLATSLALSFAEATKRPTLLIDADLRSPSIAKLLNVPARPGIAELLDGKANLEQVMHRVGESNTFVLPAGRLKGNPHHVFEVIKIDDLLELSKRKFGTIFIDTPPILSASDSLVYAKAADLVLFCSLADTSRASQVRQAVERLQATGANVAGAVLSGVPANSYAYRYGTYGR